MKYFLILLVQILFLSCSTKEQLDQENIENAVDSAQIYLTKNQCNEAIKVLGTISDPGNNVEYIKTYASAFACRANFRIPRFYGSDLTKINTTLTGFFPSAATFSTSQMTAPDDAYFVDMWTAINALIYAGGVTIPSSSERAKIFTSDELSDINIFALYLVFAEIGKYLYYYGNVNPVTGEKGAGSSTNGNPNYLTNSCLYNYDPQTPSIATQITLAKTLHKAGNCVLTSTGHPFLPALPEAVTVKRMCQGIILFNQLMDLISNITIPGKETDLQTISTEFKDLCTTAGIGDLCSVLSQTQCEENYNVLGSLTDKLQTYIFAVFEVNF